MSADLAAQAIPGELTETSLTLPEGVRPDSEKVASFASQSLENARRTLAKLRRDVEQRGGLAEPPDAIEEARDIEDAEVMRGSDEHEGFPENPDDFEFTDEEIGRAG